MCLDAGHVKEWKRSLSYVGSFQTSPKNNLLLRARNLQDNRTKPQTPEDLRRLPKIPKTFRNVKITDEIIEILYPEVQKDLT